MREERERFYFTLQLEKDALAGGNLGTGLAHSLERPRHLLLVAARDTVGDHVHVVPALEEVQGGLQHAYVRLGGRMRRSRGASRETGGGYAPRCP
jgi:hypothetical protein